VRSSLVAALVACADRRLRPKARRFVAGLSTDELQFIAEYVGAVILESAHPGGCSRSQLATGIARFQEARQGCPGCRSRDDDHKMILLLEYLCRSGIREFPVLARA